MFPSGLINLHLGTYTIGVAPFSISSTVFLFAMPGKKPKKLLPFRCANPLCGKVFESLKGLNLHRAMVLQCKMNSSNNKNVTDKASSRHHNLAPDTLATGTSDFCLAMDSIVEEDDTVVNEVCASTNANIEVETLESTLHQGMPHTKSQYHEVKLLRILDAANAQHYLFKDIMLWAREAMASGYTFKPNQLDRDNYIQTLATKLHMNGQRPEKVVITLPSIVPQVPKKIELVRFQFRYMLESLLTDPDLVGDLSNLDVNQDDPFGQYRSPNNVLSCVNSGRWYMHAYKHLCKDPKDFLLCPIIMASDEAKLT